jgi:uncharacterized protein (TIGR03435 family)
MIRTVTAIFALTSMAAFAQPSGAPAFEVASIRAGQPGRESIEYVPGSLTMRNVRLTACIRWAYDVPEFQVTGPDWMNDTWFDIAAKAGSPAPEAELRVMLRTLLADRFKLATHRQTKEISALVLTVGKNGHKMKPVETTDPPSFNTGKLSLTGQGATLSQLTAFLSREIRNPIVDQTGLTGRFNYTLDINSYVTDEVRKSQGPNGGPPPDAPSIIAQAIQAQLGLRLDAKKVPVEMIVVDRLEKTPTEN